MVWALQEPSIQDSSHPRFPYSWFERLDQRRFFNFWRYSKYTLFLKFSYPRFVCFLSTKRPSEGLFAPVKFKLDSWKCVLRRPRRAVAAGLEVGNVAEIWQRRITAQLIVRRPGNNWRRVARGPALSRRRAHTHARAPRARTRNAAPRRPAAFSMSRARSLVAKEYRGEF